MSSLKCYSSMFLTAAAFALFLAACGKSSGPKSDHPASKSDEGKAWELNNRKEDANHLKKIASACVVWAANHDDHLPDHLAQLIANKSIEPGELIRPGSKTTPAQFTAAQLSAAADNWQSIAKEVDAHCDYVYYGAKGHSRVDATIPLIITKAHLPIPFGDGDIAIGLTEGTNFAFEDAHVEWVRPEKWQTMIDQGNRGRSSEPPITLASFTNP